MKKRRSRLLALGVMCVVIMGIGCTSNQEVISQTTETETESKPSCWGLDLQGGASQHLKDILSNYQVATVEAEEVDLVTAGLVMEYEDNYNEFENDEEFQTGFIAKDSVKLRCFASKDASVVATYKLNTEVEYRKYNSSWYEIKYYDEDQDMDVYVYAWHESISDHKIVTCEKLYSAYTFKDRGYTYYGGYRFTWYSQKVLPGGGLNIPGRHVNEDGYVCDEDGYIVGASRDLANGTVVNSPLGIQVKIYDWCEIHGTIDIYCNF